jgi:hypothetical protein
MGRVVHRTARPIFVSWRPPTRRRSSSRGRRRLERVAQAALDRSLEVSAVEDETDGSAADDGVALGIEELAREQEGIPNAQPQDRVQLSSEGEVEKGRVGDPAGDAAPRDGDSRDLVLREDVVGPLWWRIDRK